jgi:DNA-binding response OmpR family regulator
MLRFADARTVAEPSALVAFQKHAHQVLRRQQPIELIREKSEDAPDRAIAMLFSWLRRKLALG